MPIDRKAYKAAKNKYKSAVKENKDIVKYNKKASKTDKSNMKAHSKKAKQDTKKWEKSVKAVEKMRAENPGQKFITPYRPLTELVSLNPRKIQKITGPKPRRSDYKGDKPQKATGSSSSNARMHNMVNTLNKFKTI